MANASLHIPLSEKLKVATKLRVAESHYSNPTDYVRQLISKDILHDEATKSKTVRVLCTIDRFIAAVMQRTGVSMTAITIGRNDPCPCGSGIKFKKCCLGKSGTAPSHLNAEDVSEELRHAMQGIQFSSLEEAQEFSVQHTQQLNQRLFDEFHGLSPDQMYRILYFPFTSTQCVVFSETLNTTPQAPILSLFELMVEAIGEKGLKPTAKGNLPQKFCREAALSYWDEETRQVNMQFGKINREEDFFDLHVTRKVAELAGLIRKYKGRFILSRDCRSLLESGGASATYPRLLRTYIEKFNWSYRDGYEELRIIQSTALFTLYLLSLYGDTCRAHTFYEDNFLHAFPAVLEEVPEGAFSTADDIVRRCYTLRTLEYFAGFLGLAVLQADSKEILNRKYQVKALPLLRAAVQFHSHRQ